jgi:hypothetical protein
MVALGVGGARRRERGRASRPLVGVALVVMGGRRDHAVRVALAEGRFDPLGGRAVVVITVALVLLGFATLVLLALES